MSKVLIGRNLPESVVDEARALFDVTYRDSPYPLSREEMLEALAGYDGVLVTLGDGFSAEVFEQAGAPRAKILANFGVGFNHIDVAAAEFAGITVTNTPGAVTDATADIAMTLMLMTCRRAAEGERLVRSGQWEGWHPVQMLGLHMTGKRVGILGMGRIGQAIARRCHFGFGMSVAYASRSEKNLDFPAERYGSPEALAAEVDVLVVSVPASPETHHMVDAGVLAAMKPAAHLVNIARGDIVDEAALIAALEARQIGGAGLDVYEFEPKVPEALRALDNVVLLPHLGTSTLEVREDMGRMAVENLRAFFAGEKVPNRVGG
ncbi:2-hydroxyacid dehydrogenase [Salipiger bermudensis]|uniref:D-isomer specific 2-hydroxyacid dehydrogenase family protein n=1 Tax=Salipiger bermudensis (strain DSM 26914 / JCM 13377 / KCTC 12554 / HTCC2601) TaxID=314265 RepID=Q0FM85_SALBH|nr:D-glycerate dehydrogenase [Salipiger bermudensis]EAU45240.1 D-isomer specific 2-hydroxyacid dehydrogenase family protein [Salipiger bermudensis HTCC2601]